MKTLLNGDTMDLNIVYSGEIEVTTDVFNLYVLDKANKRIDQYLKATLEKVGNYTSDDALSELITGYGESYIYFCTISDVAWCS